MALARPLALLLLPLLLLGCRSGPGRPEHRPLPALTEDVHSAAAPETVRVRHALIDWNLDFEEERVVGSVTWLLDRAEVHTQEVLRLDTKALDLLGVEVGNRAGLHETTYSLGAPDPILGRALRIPLPPFADRVRIAYTTTALGTGLQWLEASQTKDGQAPFLFSQAQAIHGRTMLPCQDSPAVRFTYEATVRAPAGVTVVMAAERLGGRQADGSFRFRMEQPIPSYLLAIAAGALQHRAIGPRTGVWAEPSVVEAAAWEFGDTEKMLERAEELYGSYRWDRYDILVLPPSFPFGGMENPRLTFATPTILAGDRSLVDLVAHELAHSWSGNLVTNATWADFWLNEGFTVYFERRIQEAVYGEDRARMEAVLGHDDLLATLEALPRAEWKLHVDLRGRDPDDGLTSVPYEKGYLFLRTLEEAFGRERFDTFLANWFDEHAWTSQTTPAFERFLVARLFEEDRAAARAFGVRAWLYGSAIPDDADTPTTDAFEVPGELAMDYGRGEATVEDVAAADFGSYPRWLHFLRRLPRDLDPERMAALDETFAFTETGNYEILAEWLELAVLTGYEAADGRLESFLKTVGRRKFLTPLYEALLTRPDGAERARAIYTEARPLYHPIARNTIDALLDWPAPRTTVTLTGCEH